MVTANDASGNGHTGTYNGSATSVTGLVTGDADTAVEFTTATDDFVASDADYATGTTLTAFTIGCVFKFTSFPADAPFPFSMSVSGDEFDWGIHFWVHTSDGIINFDAGDLTGFFPSCVSSTAVVADGSTIYDVVATYDANVGGNSVAKLYVNGVLEDTVSTTTGSFTMLTPAGVGFTAGNAYPSDPTGSMGDGVVDECFFSDTVAATAGQVTAIHAARTGTGDITTAIGAVGPYVYWRLGEDPAGGGGGDHTIIVPAFNAAPTIDEPDVVGGDGTFVAAFDATPDIFPPSVGVHTSATGDEGAPTYVTRVVNMAGVTQLNLTNAEPDTVTWTLNQPDAAEFHFGKNAYSIDDLRALVADNEIQIFRNGDLLTWGPIIGAEGRGSDGAVTGHVAGVDWYLNRRFIDAPNLNHLSNPDFESSTSDWTTQGAVTFTVDTANFKTGSHSAKLVGANSSGDQFITQSAVFGPNGVGVLVIVGGWFFIEQFTNYALETRGLYIEGIESGVFQENNYYVIDNATPRGKWVKASTSIWVPPHKTWAVNARLYAPEGTVRWDDIKLVQMDSVGSTGTTGSTTVPADISQIIRSLLVLMQDTTRGKSFINLGMHSETVGTKMVKDYQFAEHVQFDQAVREFIERDDGIDYSIDLTPTTRTYHQYAGKKGTDRTGSVTLTYDVDDPAGSNCTDYSYTSDGSQLITRQVILGEDNGAEREIGEAVDTSHVDGLILQDVRQAPQGVEVASLQPLADERIGRYSVLPETIVMTVIGTSELIKLLKTGDLVNCVVNDGYVQINGERRIMQLQLKCAQNTLDVTLAQDTLP